jgi:predicted DNA-binding transcriptional regulator YafY
VEVNDGEGLYYWLLQHADNVKVITPDSVRTKLLDKVKKIVNLYDEL